VQPKKLKAKQEEPYAWVYEYNPFPGGETTRKRFIYLLSWRHKYPVEDWELSHPSKVARAFTRVHGQRTKDIGLATVARFKEAPAPTLVQIRDRASSACLHKHQ
jgi:hypothetical protein